LFEKLRLEARALAVPKKEITLPIIARDVTGQAQRLAVAFEAQTPVWPANEFVSTRLITVSTNDDELDGTALVGQRELYFTENVEKGRLVAWPSHQLRCVDEELSPGAASIEDDVSSYQFGFEWRGIEMVSSPDRRCAAPFANDFCGTDRSAARKKKCKDRLNLRFTVILDRVGLPYVFLMATRDIQAGETGLTDYGDRYWQNWQVNMTALRRAGAMGGTPPFQKPLVVLGYAWNTDSIPIESGADGTNRGEDIGGRF